MGEKVKAPSCRTKNCFERRLTKTLLLSSEFAPDFLFCRQKSLHGTCQGPVTVTVTELFPFNVRPLAATWRYSKTTLNRCFPCSKRYYLGVNLWQVWKGFVQIYCIFSQTCTWTCSYSLFTPSAAADLEFTGLRVERELQICKFDSPADR